MTKIALGFSPNVSGGRQGLIEHALWLRGDDTSLVHAFLIIDGFVVDRTFGGVQVLPCSTQQELLTKSTKNIFIADVDVHRDEFLGHCLTHTSVIDSMKLLTPFRYWFGLPVEDDLTCFSYLYGVFGGQQHDYVEPADLIRQFFDFVDNNAGEVYLASTTLPYAKLRDAGLSPIKAHIATEGYYVPKD
jgi:hypothetical protein